MENEASCNKCGLLHGDRRRCSYDVFAEALAGFDLTEGDERLLRWLAGYDQESAFVSLLTRLRRGPAQGTAEAPTPEAMALEALPHLSDEDGCSLVDMVTRAQKRIAARRMFAAGVAAERSRR
jgi:hypothetical protein